MKFTLIAAAIIAASAIKTERALGGPAADEYATWNEYNEARQGLEHAQTHYITVQHASMAEEAKLQKEIDETDVQEGLTKIAIKKADASRADFHTSTKAVQKALEAYIHAMTDVAVYKR